MAPAASRKAKSNFRPVTKVAARGRPKKSEITRARILDAAAEVFRQKGYALTRLSDIAKKARTRTSSIYYYFESREAIVGEVLRIANEQTVRFVTESLAALPAETSPREKIIAAIRGHFTLVLSGNPYTFAHMRIFDQIPPKLREHFLRVLDEYAQVWRGLLVEAQEAGEIRTDLNLSVVRQLLLGMMNWSIEWYRPDAGLSPEQIAEQAAAILLDGLGPAASRRDGAGK